MIVIRYLLVLMILTSCHFNSQYINREEDKVAAEKVTSKLFEACKKQNYESTLKFYSDKFFEVTNGEKIIDIYTATHEKLGNLLEINLELWETRRVEGSNPSADYLLCLHEQV